MTNRRQATVSLISLGASGWLYAAQAQSLTSADAAQGIRTALARGAESSVQLLGKPGGYLDNPKVRIPLPGFLEDAAKLLRALGQGAKVDELVTAMNRAAEAAAPEAKTLLLNAARSITLQDALAIVRGGETSVMDYFSTRTREPLAERFLPIVEKATRHVALAEKYNSFAKRASAAGLLKAKDSRLEPYVTGKALDGLYAVIGEEERKIRRDPLGAGSDILRKVFGR